MVYLILMKRVFIVSCAAAAVAVSNLVASADYTIVLKNGRQFDVQNFREEADIIKFHGFGGEISILKNQIQTIRPASEAKWPREAAPPSAAPVPENRVPAREPTNTAAQSPGGNPASE